MLLLLIFAFANAEKNGNFLFETAHFDGDQLLNVLLSKGGQVKADELNDKKAVVADWMLTKGCGLVEEMGTIHHIKLEGQLAQIGRFVDKLCRSKKQNARNTGANHFNADELDIILASGQRIFVQMKAKEEEIEAVHGAQNAKMLGKIRNFGAKFKTALNGLPEGERKSQLMEIHHQLLMPSDLVGMMLSELNEAATAPKNAKNGAKLGAENGTKNWLPNFIGHGRRKRRQQLTPLEMLAAFFALCLFLKWVPGMVICLILFAGFMQYYYF